MARDQPGSDTLRQIEADYRGGVHSRQPDKAFEIIYLISISAHAGGHNTNLTLYIVRSEHVANAGRFYLHLVLCSKVSSVQLSIDGRNQYIFKI